jgi:SAM-dependent methyltransferase
MSQPECCTGASQVAVAHWLADHRRSPSHRCVDKDRQKLVRSLAGRYCDRSGNDCRWYHGSWELLKSLGVVSTSAVHAAEIERLLSSTMKTSPDMPRVLISGSTDETLLQIASTAYERADRQVEFTALDICATPLKLMRQYADCKECQLQTVRKNILDYCPAERFDVILTHAFMGNFAAVDRAALARKWASLLTTGGRIVTIQRVRPEYSPETVRFNEEQSAGFVAAVTEAAGNDEGFTPEERQEAVEAAITFASRFSGYAIRSRQELESPFRDAGLDFTHLEYRKLEQRGELAGPSVPSGGEYAFIISGRR